MIGSNGAPAYLTSFARCPGSTNRKVRPKVRSYDDADGNAPRYVPAKETSRPTRSQRLLPGLSDPIIGMMIILSSRTTNTDVTNVRSRRRPTIKVVGAGGPRATI
jgi:hypothetical protein